jgi:hypothetical protein
VKYFWKDAIKNQLKDKDVKKELLITRLNCLDVSGLGLSPLAGGTLVQYAGSLVGRDFRAIAQVAPFVLADLVSSDCYDTWKCLSRLVPLVWQPKIDDLESYLVCFLFGSALLCDLADYVQFSKHSPTKLNSSSSELLAGVGLGLTNLSSISLSTSRAIYADLARPFFLLRRPLNHSMPSSVQRVFIQTARLLPVISLGHLPMEIEFGTS